MPEENQTVENLAQDKKAKRSLSLSKGLIPFAALCFVSFIVGFFVGQNYNSLDKGFFFFEKKDSLETQQQVLISESCQNVFVSQVETTDILGFQENNETQNNETQDLLKIQQAEVEDSKSMEGEGVKTDKPSNAQSATLRSSKKAFSQNFLKDMKKQGRKTKRKLSPAEVEAMNEWDKRVNKIRDQLMVKQREYDKKNKQWLASIKNEQQDFVFNGKYSFFINAFSDEKKALDYIVKFKKTYPLWNFFIQIQETGSLKIYLGPFDSRERAMQFIRPLPQPLPFPNYFLEEQSLTSKAFK